MREKAYQLLAKMIRQIKMRPLCAIAWICVLIIVLMHELVPEILFHNNQSEEFLSMLMDGEDMSVSGEVDGVTEKDESYLVLIRNAAWVKNGVKENILGIRIWFSKQPQIQENDEVVLTGTLKEISKATVYGQFDANFYYKIRGYGYQMSNPSVKIIRSERKGFSLKNVLSTWRNDLTKRLNEAFEGNDQGVFAAVLLGDKTSLDEDLKSLWQTAGVVHMLVISGLHMTLVAATLDALLQKIGLRVHVAIILSFSLLVLYAALTSFGVATLRALIMYGYRAGARLLGRKADKWNSFALALLLILIGNPAYLFDAGFQLSFLAVFLLTAFANDSALETTLVLQMGLLPLLAYYYYELPLFSLLFNFVLVPLMPLIFACGVLGLAGGGLFSGFLALPGKYLLYFINLLLKIIKKITPLTLITGRPSLLMMGFYWILLTVCVLVFNHYQHKKRRFFLFLFFPVLIFMISPSFWPKGNELYMNFLDVGQGDGIFIRASNGENCLVDGGSSSVDEVGDKRILPFLKASGVKSLDYLIVTHMDTDHYSGALEILEMVGEHETSLKIKNLLLPVTEEGESSKVLTEAAEKAGVRVTYVKAGDSLLFKADSGKSTKIRFFSPADGETYESSNAGCLVADITMGNFNAFLTGDVEGEAENALTEELKKEKKEGKLPSYEILKVAHHGSKNSSSAEFLNLVDADAYIISCGLHNLYGHPHSQLIARLLDTDGHIFKTMYQGSISVTSDGDTWRIGTYLD